MPLGGPRRALGLASIAVVLAALSTATAPRAPAAWPRTVTLQVVTALGGPAVGARVDAWDDLGAAGAPPVGERSRAPTRQPEPPRASEAVGASGLCVITLHGPETVLAAGIAGLASSGLWSARTLEDGPLPPVVLYPSGVIEGVVRTTDGSAVADARVEFRSPASNPDWTRAACGRGLPRAGRWT
jgi:hypothetical protein